MVLRIPLTGTVNHSVECVALTAPALEWILNLCIFSLFQTLYIVYRGFLICNSQRLFGTVSAKIGDMLPQQ
jgi:hypothetical protein